MLQPGDKRRFLYPNYGDPDGHPDYSAHSTQIVSVTLALSPDEYDVGELDEDGEPFDRMYEVQSEDGWTGHVWESELHDLEFPFAAGKDQNGNDIRMPALSVAEEPRVP